MPTRCARAYAYLFYVLRRTQTLVGNEGRETWFSLVIVTWVQALLAFSCLGLLQLRLHRFLSYSPLGVAVTLVATIGLSNYLLFVRSGNFHRFDAEFSRHSATRAAIGFTLVYGVLACCCVTAVVVYAAETHLR